MKPIASLLTLAIIVRSNAGPAPTASIEVLWTKTDTTNIAFTLVFSPSGRYLAAGSSGKNFPDNDGPSPVIRIFEAETGILTALVTNQPAFTVPGHEARPAFAFRGDAQLVCGTAGGHFRTYAIPSGLQSGSFDLSEQIAGPPIFSDPPKYVALHTQDSQVDYFLDVWDLNTGNLVHRFDNGNSYSSPIFSPDGHHLALFQSPLGYDCTWGSSCWSLLSFDPINIPHFSDGCLGPSVDPKFSPNSRYFLFSEHSWWVYDFANSSEFTLPWGNGVFTPDSKRVFALSSDLSYVFIPVKPGGTPELAVTGIVNNRDDIPTAMAMSPTGDSIAHAKSDGTITLIKNPFAAVRFDASRKTEQGLQLEWEGGSGHYRLEGTDHLPSTTWQMILEDTNETRFTLPLNSSTLFFRLQYLPPQ